MKTSVAFPSTVAMVKIQTKKNNNFYSRETGLLLHSKAFVGFPSILRQPAILCHTTL